MVLTIDMTNPTEEGITLDNLTSKVKFTADYSADGAESAQVSAYTTIMTTDFQLMMMRSRQERQNQRFFYLRYRIP